MRSLRAFLIRLGGFLQRTRREREMNDEIESHLQFNIDDNLRAGMNPEEARRQAVLKLGSIEATKEAMRDRQSLPWMEHLAQDVRIAFRSLRKSPGFTTVAMLTLALCIGANSAVFSVVHSILLKPYPWPESERLVQIFNSFPRSGRERTNISVADYIDRRKGMKSLEESALLSLTGLNFAAAGVVPERIAALNVTPSFFPLLNARPAMGRTFSPADAEIGAPKTVVLSDALWRNQFGADPAIIGSTIRLDSEPHTVIGVMPPAFYYPTPATKLWVPFAFNDRQRSDGYLGGTGSIMIGRLKPGVTVAQAQSEIDACVKSLVDRLPQLKGPWEASGFRGLVVRFHDANVQDVRTTLWMVQGAVAAVLLIGCVTVASLLLARASARERELAIRAALGAGRWRLIRHLLSESVLLFIAGGLLGLLVAVWGVVAINSLGIGKLPRGFGVSIDFVAVAFTLLCAGLSGVVFGALPAWSVTRDDSANTLKDAGARATTARRHLSVRSMLVVTEIAVALALLAAAGLLIKSFKRVQEVSPGFNGENVLAASFALPDAKRETAEQLIHFQNRLLERLHALPGVTWAACTNRLPLGADFTFSFQVEDFESSAGQPPPQAAICMVSPEYFRTLGIPLLRGRTFVDRDTTASNDVVVIDQALADRYWPGENPIGKRLIYGSRPIPNSTKTERRKWEIIGVVAPVKLRSLEEPDTKPTIYLSTLQATYPLTGIIVARTTGSPSHLIAALRAAVLAVDPELPLSNVRTLEAMVETSMEGRHAPMVLLTVFGAVALLLATLGVYGVLSFAVGQRTKEIGVRIALGATTTNIVRMIVRQGARLVALGIVLGLGGYFALSTFIRKMLFRVETTDAAALVVAPAALALVALAACLIPARRATKVDPIVALRAE